MEKTIEAYISRQPKEVQTILKKIRVLIRKTAPKAEEGISYGLVGYKLEGSPLVYFGAFKKHIGFFATPSGHTAFQKQLSAYKRAKGSVQFPYDMPIPYPLIKKIVTYRVKENKAKSKPKKK